MPTDAEAATRPGLGDFAADALEWGAVRELLARHAPGALGRRRLLRLEPRPDGEARLALARTAELLAFGTGSVALGAVEDPEPVLAAAREENRPLDGDGLRAVLAFLRGARTGLAFLRDHGQALTACASLAEGAPDLADLEELLDASLDERGRLVDDASPLLARLRAETTKLGRRIEEAVRRLAAARQVRGVLAEGHAGRVHRRAGRPVLAVRARSRGSVPGLVHDRSQSGETVFVEPQEVVEDGNRLAELAADASREEGRILTELTRRVRADEESIERLALRLAELELVRLGAAWAEATDGVVPELAGDPGAGEGLVLRGMRHPLLVESLAVGTLEEVVPLDLRLAGDFDMLIVTGPNTGGKTLALKSAGLACLLARLGLPIPARRGTTVPLLDGIAADIGDEQEVSQNLSTFSSHLVRIRDGLERATPRTLVLLDELGGGTDPDEGAALGEAILEVLLERGVPTIVSTHLGKLKEFAFRHPRAENASVEFDLETLAPRYRLLVGTPGESRALYVARRLGIAPEVLRRAEERVERRSGEVLALLEDVRRSRERAEELRGQAEQRLSDIQVDERKLSEAREAVDTRGRLLEAEAQRGLEERMRGARPLIERGRSILPQLPRAARAALEEVLDELEETLAGASLGERREAFLDRLKKGQLVYVPRFRKRLTVLRVWRDRRELKVRLGTSELVLGFEEITEYEGL